MLKYYTFDHPASVSKVTTLGDVFYQLWSYTAVEDSPAHSPGQGHAPSLLRGYELWVKEAMSQEQVTNIMLCIQYLTRPLFSGAGQAQEYVHYRYPGKTEGHVRQLNQEVQYGCICQL